MSGRTEVINEIRQGMAYTLQGGNLPELARAVGIPADTARQVEELTQLLQFALGALMVLPDAPEKPTPEEIERAQRIECASEHHGCKTCAEEVGVLLSQPSGYCTRHGEDIDHAVRRLQGLLDDAHGQIDLLEPCPPRWVGEAAHSSAYTVSGRIEWWRNEGAMQREREETGKG